ncbi:uncharacterized protein LY79DRAFT_585422 [Colletotrichum navitas]|uniref:Uncharacterized protein n=1 Tax=Colletotrichum navitas TaxID=681940 RepID=A0AAD8PJ71_9PEZI|nr:uncharacterized protein LY79DRAFT_585422 [Colletotrichum navitas]KAK1561714.1 hypothetical protein LY79DRAFT_585422 [Colletotrichum navitas]
MRCHVLATPFGFHTLQVHPILVPFFKLLSKVRVRDPVVPVIFLTLSRVLRKSLKFGDGYLVRHCRNIVNIQEALNITKSEGLVNNNSIDVEIVPALVICRMAKDIVGTHMQTFVSMHKGMYTWQLLVEAMAGMYMAGVNIRWDKYHEDFPECYEVLQLPACGWTMKEYWLQFPHSSIYRVVKDTLRGSADGQTSILWPRDTESMVFRCALRLFMPISLSWSATTSLTEIAEMHIQSALVANDVGKEQILCTDAKFDKQSNTVFCTFSSVDLADFDPKYCGLSAATLNNDTFEAAGIVSFKGIPHNNTWFSNPVYIDAISQIGAFVMNANDGVDLENEIFVNHGWESMKLLTPKLDLNMTYHSYVKMTEGESRLWIRDVVAT